MICCAIPCTMFKRLHKVAIQAGTVTTYFKWLAYYNQWSQPVTLKEAIITSTMYMHCHNLIFRGTNKYTPGQPVALVEEDGLRARKISSWPVAESLAILILSSPYLINLEDISHRIFSNFTTPQCGLKLWRHSKLQDIAVFQCYFLYKSGGILS